MMTRTKETIIDKLIFICIATALTTAIIIGLASIVAILSIPLN